MGVETCPQSLHRGVCVHFSAPPSFQPELEAASCPGKRGVQSSQQCFSPLMSCLAVNRCTCPQTVMSRLTVVQVLGYSKEQVGRRKHFVLPGGKKSVEHRVTVS